VQLCGPGNVRNLMYLCMTPAYVHVSARNNRNLSYARQCKQLYAETLHSIFGVSAWSAAGSDRLRPMRAALGTLVLWLCTSAFLTAENGPARDRSHLSICLPLIMGAEASCTPDVAISCADLFRPSWWQAYRGCACARIPDALL